MTVTSPDRTGILIVRLWLEERGKDRFRARVSQTRDSGKNAPTWSTAGNPEDLYAAIRAWVEEFVESG